MDIHDRYHSDDAGFSFPAVNVSMQYGPPSLFKQGTPARVKVIIFVVVAIVLLFVDARLQMLGKVRHVIGMMIYPVQRIALVPRDLFEMTGEYLFSVGELHDEVDRLREKEVQDAQVLERIAFLENENRHLRELLGMSQRIRLKSVPAEILYDAHNAFMRKVVLNRGSRHGVLPGQPVIDENGVIGQVTEVYLTTCEVTLLTDKDQAIPVLNARSGERSVAYGRGQQGYLELRFMMDNADIQQGDLLVTSGIDGVYPAGLAVGKVAMMHEGPDDLYSNIICEPSAGINRNRQVLVLLSDTNVTPRPATNEQTVVTRKRVAPQQNDAEGGK